MAKLDLHYVDEIIGARHEQHGGAQGAPLKIDGHRVGAALNRSCIVMLSSLLQSFVEEVFQEAAKRKFAAIAADEAAFNAYWKQMKGWGNPSEENIRTLFLKLGVPDVFSGLSWKNRATPDVRRKLNELNLLRNQIAHGARGLKLNNQAYSMSLVRATEFRDFALQFGERFEGHVTLLLP